MDNYVGKKLDGRYEIQELIGVGGMAVVYKAYDRIDDRIVSIKILKDEYLGNEEFTRRFKNESRAIAVLSHPNIVKVYDVSFGDRLQYIVMEYIDGITLKEYIEQQKTVTWKEAVHFTLQILHALQHAHSKGIIHRDIKPQNIMLLSDGTIKVTDFGIARFSNSETRTMTDKAIGSVHYIAPEQACGSLTDEKADIYSVGVMLYEMLTGTLPFEAENAVSVAIMQMQSEPRSLKDINPSIPEGLEEITLKAMKKDPQQRYANAAEMIDAITKFKQNPEIKFQYKYFLDDKPTRHVDELDVVEEVIPDEIAAGEDETEREDMAVKSSRVPPVPVITGVAIAFAVFAIVFGIILFVRNLPKENKEEVYLPNFVGQNIESVKNEYGDIFDLVVVGYESDSELEDGTVKSQVPKGDVKSVVKHSRVELVVSSGVALTEVPAVVGKEESQAISMLTEKKLNYVPTEVYHDSIAVGYVVAVTPGEGQQIPENETVQLYVSKGPEEKSTVVTKFIGMTYEEAKREIVKAGFKVGTPKYENSTEAKDTVIGQNPDIGTTLNQGETIILTLSNGNPPAPVENTVQFEATLPDVKTAVVDVFVNGVKNNEQSKTVLTSNMKKYPVTLTGTGTATVTIYVNGQDFEGWEVNFDQKTATQKYTNTYTNSSQSPSSNSSTSSGGSQPPVESTEPDTSSKHNGKD